MVIGNRPKIPKISWVELFLFIDITKKQCYIGCLMKNNTQQNRVEKYAKLRNKGFSNKQIAIYWRMTIAQIAGVQSWASRRGLVAA